ncbi:serine O-acetyltransferase [Cognatishimia activa]|uniref:Serine acetyltransferase n=1 Tax=Cognatishimia activa TaxID=1715691 RepID=A0A0P1IMU8_9RHOB|nr:serine acetyltransferase [Cognatishimia activa]MEE2945172.1 serine acetyltransferase [Pseudomonadota bacterium]CUJ13273.1 Serine acetyltransferase [Cognatishimia activa]CUK24956.1 Serine acetyltransferase [Cognatishimia activa]
MSDDVVSATDPDWSRENVRSFWDPGPKLLRAIRRYQVAQTRGGLIGKLASKYWVLMHRFWSVMTQCEIHLHMPIAGGLRLPHPTGIVIHPESSIGPNSMIFQQVTLAGPCKIGGHVDIGAGAKIIGPVTIGDHAVIGANAVVTKDVNAYETVAGIPAKVISTRQPD